MKRIQISVAIGLLWAAMSAGLRAEVAGAIRVTAKKHAFEPGICNQRSGIQVAGCGARLPPRPSI
jgi:hypothetical protein